MFVGGSWAAIGRQCATCWRQLRRLAAKYPCPKPNPNRTSIQVRGVDIGQTIEPRSLLETIGVEITVACMHTHGSFLHAAFPQIKQRKNDNVHRLFEGELV
jgi:hypothetical protein